jgi:hypothetical protein
MYCPSCGAKIVASRLTFKGLFTDVLERFFDLDNSFYQTVKTMTVRPEKVIGSYIEGVRRRYLNPMSYLGVALGLSGFMFFIFQKYGIDLIDMDFLGPRSNIPANKKLMDAIIDFQTFVFLLYIPVIAFAGILSFNSRGYNLPEHFVSAIYTLSHIAILTFPISLLMILFAPQVYLGYSLVSLLLMFGFSAFVLIRIHRYPSVFIVLIRTIVFMVLLMIGYFGIAIGIHLLMLFSGITTVQDYLPPEA